MPLLATRADAAATLLDDAALPDGATPPALLPPPLLLDAATALDCERVDREGDAVSATAALAGGAAAELPSATPRRRLCRGASTAPPTAGEGAGSAASCLIIASGSLARASSSGA